MRPGPAERGLVFAIRAGLALLPLTPLVVAPDILSSHTVGKALYARSLIAVVFALWAVLAALRPAWRPRAPVLLVLFAAGFATAALAAPFGVSLQRSVWSDYGRMGGLVDAAHWLALAVVLVAMLRTEAHWHRLLNVNLGVGFAVALMAIARFHVPGASGLGWPAEPHYPRIAVTLGNPIFLGAYMQAVALVALGFLTRSFLGVRAGRTATAGAGPARLFWLSTAGCALWALALSGSMGAMAGLAAGLGGAGLYYAVLGASRRARRAGLASIGVLAVAGAALAASLLLHRPDGPVAGVAPGSALPLLERATDPARVGSTLGKRLDNWRAGLQAFAERPLLGWGPENYLVAVSRHDRAAAPTNRGRDRAHNMAVEKAVTEGVPGLLAWLALWGFTFVVIVGAARRAAAPERALAVFAGAALLGWLVQSLTIFYSATTWLQHVLLLGFAAHLEPAMRSPAREGSPDTLPVSMLRRRAVRYGLAAAAILLACGSLAANHAAYRGAAALYRAEHVGPFMAELRRSMRAFEPLATFPRILLFENVAPNWHVILAHDSAKAFRLLDWAEAEAREALADEPDNWQLHHALAKMYAAVAETHPRYEATARHFYRRSLEVAPWQDPLMPGKPGRPRGDRQ